MLTRLDHLVILVYDLERAVRGYEELGFTVTPGGEHADGLTHNALVAFEDGSYLELVAFLDPHDPRDNVWGWRTFLPVGGGLIEYCAASGSAAVSRWTAPPRAGDGSLMERRSGGGWPAYARKAGFSRS